VCQELIFFFEADLMAGNLISGKNIFSTEIFRVII